MGRSGRRPEIAAKPEQIPERERSGKYEQQGPKGQQAVATFIGIVVEKQGAKRKEEGRGQEGKQLRSEPIVLLQAE